jgi:hypothetical protein
VTAEPAPCDPNWRDQPAELDAPSRFLQRVHEIADQRGQQASPRALWTAHTIHAPEYL